MTSRDGGEYLQWTGLSPPYLARLTLPHLAGLLDILVNLFALLRHLLLALLQVDDVQDDVELLVTLLLLLLLALLIKPHLRVLMLTVTSPFITEENVPLKPPLLLFISLSLE